MRRLLLGILNVISKQCVESASDDGFAPKFKTDGVGINLDIVRFFVDMSFTFSVFNFPL
jgi:hypothetical protein